MDTIGTQTTVNTLGYRMVLHQKAKLDTEQFRKSAQREQIALPNKAKSEIKDMAEIIPSSDVVEPLNSKIVPFPLTLQTFNSSREHIGIRRLRYLSRPHINC